MSCTKRTSTNFEGEILWLDHWTLMGSRAKRYTKVLHPISCGTKHLNQVMLNTKQSRLLNTLQAAGELTESDFWLQPGGISRRPMLPHPRLVQVFWQTVEKLGVFLRTKLFYWMFLCYSDYHEGRRTFGIFLGNTSTDNPCGPSLSKTQHCTALHCTPLLYLKCT